VALIGKLHGRVTQLHLKDLKEGIAMPSFVTSLPENAFQPLGAGIIPMEPIIVAAKAAGVKHCHVEQDQSPAPMTDIATSMAYLRKL
jgi:sugar phosphate isomerase/epimerase